jgi:hypothetical protein
LLSLLSEQRHCLQFGRAQLHPSEMNAGLRGFFVVKTLTGPSPHARKLLTALLAPHRRHPFQHRESGRPVGERAITCSQVLGSGWEGDTRKVNIYAGNTRANAAVTCVLWLTGSGQSLCCAFDSIPFIPFCCRFYGVQGTRGDDH